VSNTVLPPLLAALVLVVVARQLGRGFLSGDPMALSRGILTLGLGLGGFIISFLVISGHTAGAIAAGGVISVLLGGGLVVWALVFRPLLRSRGRTPSAPRGPHPPAERKVRNADVMNMMRGVAAFALLLGVGAVGYLIRSGRVAAAISAGVILLILIGGSLVLRKVVFRHVPSDESGRERGEEEPVRTRRQAGAGASGPMPGVSEASSAAGAGSGAGVGSESAKSSAAGPRAASPPRRPGVESAEAEPERLSQIETRFLRMTLDHSTGRMTGVILAGREKGKALEGLGLDHLLELVERWRGEDPSSAAVLETWLDRTQNTDWRSRLAGKTGNDTASRSLLTREEAFAVLNLPDGAAPEAIKEAHRRLMARVHPDQGGSTWLASKVNEARDVLLRT
jgi:hypothetical protein